MDAGRMASAKRTAVYLLLFTASWRICGSLLRRFFTRKLTVLNELPRIGHARPEDRRINGIAVICGGSVAGLYAARICADHFENVCIIEPEGWLATEEGRSAVYDERGVYIASRREHKRSRVEQYSSVHIFQPIALRALNHLFSDFEDNIKKADGRILDPDFRIHVCGGRILRLPQRDYPDGKYPQCLFTSRELFERTLRGSVMKSSDRIRWVVGTATGARTASDDASRLSSVTVRTASGTEEVIPAALVVDCTGGAQVGFKWVKRIYNELQKNTPLGVPQIPDALPFEELRMEYSTSQRSRNFRFYVPPEARARLPIPGGYDENTGLIYSHIPEPGKEVNSVLINRIEGHRIEVALNTRGNLELPSSVEGIKPFFADISTLYPAPEWVSELLEILLEYNNQAENFGVKKWPTYSWIHYERAPYIPSNFVAIGDATMRVNPGYGQGCTKACMGAVVLDSMLRSSRAMNTTSILPDFGRVFAKLHAEKTSSAWNGSKPTDYQWPTTTPVKGEQLSTERLAGRFANILVQLSLRDDKVDATLFHVRSFLAPPTDLMHPVVLAKVLFYWVRQRLGMV